MYFRTLILSILFVCATALGIQGNAFAQCTNTCSTSHDGECDDGGPGSLYSICTLGSDCSDCGVRATTSTTCTNTCSTSYDGECDDGGPGSLYSICGYGTDCSDCGVRGAAAAAPTPAPSGQCTNTCSTARDGECDDGGPGSLYSICSYGTDCNDCGVR